MFQPTQQSKDPASTSWKSRFERSRSFRPLVVAVTLAVFAVAMAIITQQQRRDLEVQILSRDAEILNAVARLHLEEVLSESGGSGQSIEETTLFGSVLKTSRLKGVIAARLFNPDASFNTSFPINVSDGVLAPEDLPVLRLLKPAAHFHPAHRMEDLFFDASLDAQRAGRQFPLVEVVLPLAGPDANRVSGYAQFFIEGTTVAEEFLHLRNSLFVRAVWVFLVGAAVIVLAVGWAFGRLQSVNRVLRERTRRLQKANQELALTAKTSALGSVAAHLVHGMKNPLFGLHAIASERASAETLGPEGDWNVVSEAARRLQTLVNETVTILSEEEQSDRYEMTLVEVLDPLQAKFKPMAAAAGLSFSCATGVSGRVDNRTASLLGLILSNLVHNAIQATASGREVRLESRLEGGSLEFRVVDQGAGIPESIQRGLFSPVRSTKATGSGIGLAISRQLAQHLGAALQLLQTGPEGTTFSLTLPPEAFHPTSSATSAAQSGTSPSNSMTSAATAAENSLRRIMPLGLFAYSSLVLLASFSASAQFPRWRWANPSPHGNHIFDSVNASGLTVQVGDRGQAFVSSDLLAWEPQDTGSTSSLRAVTFHGDRIIVTGENGTLLWADSLAEWNTAVSDTPTTDWLEGVASSGTSLVAVGDNGAVYTSDTGTNWVRRKVSFTTWLTSVTYGSAKGFVAVGEGGFVATSSSGNGWNPQKSGVTASLYRARFLNGAYYAMGEKGTLISSTDGQKWSVIPTGSTNTLFDLTWNGSTYLLVGDGEVLMAATPGTWVNALAPAAVSRPPRWMYFTALWLGSEFLVGGRVGMTVHGFSETGSLTDLSLTWDTHSDAVHNWLWDVVHVPGRYVAVGDLGTLLTSDNGAEWSLELPPDTATNAILSGVAGSTNMLVAVGSKGTVIYSQASLTNIVSTNLVLVDIGVTNTVVETNDVNTLGVIWSPSAGAVTTNDLQGVTMFQDLFVASGAKGSVLKSADGVHWTLLPKAGDAFLSGLTSFSNLLVAVGSRGTILTTTDLTNWTTRASGTTNWLFRVRSLNQALYAVGDNGTILSSHDGIAWAPQSSGTTRWLNDVTYVDQPFPIWLAVGNQGAVVMKTNSEASAWTPASSITQRSLYGVTHDDAGQLVSVGIEGSIQRAHLFMQTNEVSVLSFRAETNRLTFLLTGEVGQRVTLDRSEDVSSPTNWFLGPTLEFLEGSGTLLYVEQLGTNVPPGRYFRARRIP